MSGKRRKGCIGAHRTSVAVSRPTLGCLPAYDSMPITFQSSTAGSGGYLRLWKRPMPMSQQNDVCGRRTGKRS